jgi:hypothetical protein
MGYKNLTIDGIYDGFGSQYLKKLGGFALCCLDKRYRYIHTPFWKMDHTPHLMNELNQFIGFHDNRVGKRIHIKLGWYRQAFFNTDKFFTNSTLSRIREMYWSTPKPKNCEEDIVIHIRRGDLFTGNRNAKRRIVKNSFYKSKIYNILNNHNESKIKIHSEGSPENFQEIFEDYPQDFVDRINLSLNENVMTVFNDMVCCKHLFLARSSLSFTAGLLNENEVYFQSGASNSQTSVPRECWKNWNLYE